MKNVSSQKKRYPLIGLLFIASLACRSLDLTTAPTATSVPPPTLDELTFEDADTEARFKSLNGCIAGMTDETWRTTSYKLIGNFYESRWCTGTSALEDCQITESSMHNRDQHQVGLNTLFYPDQPTVVFGLGFQSLWVPKSTGWGAVFYFSEDGKTIVGEGWGVTFNYYDSPSNPPTQSVTTGDSFAYRVNETDLQFNSDESLREDLALYLESPESMRDRGIKQKQLFLAEIQAKLNNHEVTACNWSEYKGDGIPPTCNPRPMTVEEETAELQKANLFFKEQVRLLQENYQDMYTAWMAAFPFTECWE